MPEFERDHPKSWRPDSPMEQSSLSFHEELSEVRGANALLEGRVESGIQELKEAVDELEAFAYSVSHDLRAPLRAISGFSELLLKDADPALDETSLLYLNRIHRNCIHMGSLIDDLLEFSRVGRSELADQEIDIHDLVTSCIEDLRETQGGGLPEIDVGLLPRCRGDWRLIKQVFMNLISNAIKYSRESRPPHIKVSGTTSTTEVVYVVSDNGVGFDMAYVGQLFQVFQRLHRAEDYGGTGVGLALCQRIVHRHRGRIWAEAGVGRGATFSIALPREELQ